MNTLIILLSQTRGEATIEILALLIVAAIIGYVTAWLYYKSIYEKRIKALESDKHELNNRIINLNGEISNLHKNIREKDNEIENYILDNIAQRKHLLDYKSFGTATSEEKDDLKMISGIGPFIEKRLHTVDIYTFRQISQFTAQDIATIGDVIIYFSGRIERDEWVAQARELVHNKDRRTELFKRISERKSNLYYNRIGISKKEEADDLTIISGIGGWIMEKLNALDIYTFRQISNFNEEDVQIVTEAIEYFPGRIEKDEWVLQARELVRLAGKKSELHKRIMDRKGRIYYDRLGIARKHQANNLTLINGIGLWIEERLNMLDIFTFDQISKLTSEDVETLTEVLEISPGRIDRDKWVIQARELAEKQLKKEML